MARDDRKLYRFALYGQSGSGKSCLLGVMAHVGAGSRGLTCELMPVDVPRPDSESRANNELAPAEREALSLHRGSDWLNKVRERLQRGNVAEPNPPHFDNTPPTFDFRVAGAEEGARMMRLIDYSGELINPDLEHDPESFVRRLRDHLVNSDGFLILAETPRPGTTQNRAQHLVRLRQAFASLQEEKDDALLTPVAVVLTKWDRQSQIVHECADDELAKLRRFLESDLALKDLINAIGNSLAAQSAELKAAGLDDAVEAVAQSGDDGKGASTASAEGRNEVPVPAENTSSPANAAYASSESARDPRHWGLRLGNAMVFPASAFGAAMENDGKEVPSGNLRPFGILEPFIWLARRRDELDVAAFQKEWSRHRRWAYVPVVGLLRTARNLRERAARLLRRIPELTSPGLRLRALRAELRRAAMASVAGVVLIALLAAAGVHSLWLTRQFRHWESAADNPASTPEDLVAARSFFAWYRNTWKGLGLAPSGSHAEELMARIDSAHEQRAWNAVESQADGSEAQEREARKYLELLPAGKNADQAQQIVAKADAKRAERENDTWLVDIRNRVASLNSASNADALAKTIAKGFPHPGNASVTQLETLNRIREELEGKRVNFARSEFVDSYRRAMNRNDLQEASRILASQMPRDRQWQELASGFPDEVFSQADNEVRSKLSSRQFDEARSWLQRASGAVKQIESVSRAEFPQIAEKALKAIRDLNAKNGEVDEAHDRFEYGRVQENRSKQACEQYLRHAPLKTMSREVEAYRTYLAQLELPLDVRVEVRVFWDKSYRPDRITGEGENFVTVSIDGTVVFRNQEEVVEDRGNWSSVGRFDLTGKRKDQRLRIDVVIEENDSPFNPDDGGSGGQNCTLEQLERGIEIPLRPKDGGFENRARLSIVGGWPEQPPLPSWHR